MISHFHKCVFVHIPKCAGTSVEVMFLDQLDLSYSERGPLVLRPNEVKKNGPPRLAHLTARNMVRKHYISHALLKQYYSFAVVREPTDRLRSTWNYLGFKRWMTLEAFIEFVVAPALNDREGLYWFIRPQYDYVFDVDGTRLVDDVFNLSEIGELPRVLLSKGVFRELVTIPRVNSGNSRDWFSRRIQDLRILKLHGKAIIKGLIRRPKFSVEDRIRALYKMDYDSFSF